MAYKLQLKRGASGSLPTGSAGEPLFTTDTNDLYIGTGASNQRFQKYIASGTSSQFLKGDGSLDSNTYYLASNPSAYIALTALTASAPLSYNNTTGAFTIAQASGSVNGFLSSTDWTTFNNKQNALTNPVTGTGTTNYLPKWTSGSAIGNSLVFDNGTNVGIGTSSPDSKFHLAPSNGVQIRFDYVGSGDNYYDGVTHYFRNGNGAANIMTLKESANVLIGSTTDNGNRLQVTGNGYFSGNVTTGQIITMQAAAPFIRWNNVAGTRLGYIQHDASNLVYNADTGYHVFNQNLGLGVTPSAWADFKVFQNIGGSLIGEGGQLDLWQNAYYDGSSKYYANGTATRYSMSGAQHRWFNVTSGTTGNVITWNQAMTLTANGRLLLGTTTEGTELLNVAGTAIVTGKFYVGTSSVYLDYNGGGLDLATGSSTKLAISSTGAATFSSTVRVDGQVVYYAGTNTYVQGDNTDLYLGTGGVSRIKITSGGNVLVGTNTDSGEKLQVSGVITSILSSGSVRTSPSDNAGMLHIRPNAGQNGYITFTENAIADRWAIGVTNGDSNFYFRTPYPTSTPVVTIASSGAATFSNKINYTPIATPSSPSAGDVYYDSTSNKLRCYNGTSWNDLF